MNLTKIRSRISDMLESLALKIAPDDEIVFSILPSYLGGETPPSSPASNARTQKTKAKRKRQRARLRALEAAENLRRETPPTSV